VVKVTGMKKCSYCAELIKGDAKVCQYCGNLLYNKLSEKSQQISVFSSMRLILLRFIEKITKFKPMG
jgi:predicted nucleic acid-binding Zn ribbon protein